MPAPNPISTGNDINRELIGRGNEAKWANLFSGSSITAKGKPLQFVAPVVKDGQAVAILQQSEIYIESEKWLSSVVLYVVGETPTIAAVTRFIEKEWNYVSKPKVYVHDDGFFLVKFLLMIEMLFYILVPIPMQAGL